MAGFLLVCFLTGCVESSCQAGGGPENVFLVVNSRSWSSKTIANYFCQLRDIPPNCVYHLDWPYSNDVCDIDQFRELILGPIVREIDRRRLGSQIDYVVYSSDFPIRIDFRGDSHGTAQPPRFPIGSLTGLTYLAQLVQSKNVGYFSPSSNWYFPLDDAKTTSNENPTVAPVFTDVRSRGFRATLGWRRGGQLAAASEPQLRYLLSQVLGFTSGRGNSIQEVLNYLQDSSRVDGTRPEGTVYLMRNENVRSSTRHDAFPSVVDVLHKLEIDAEIMEGTIPQRRNNVLGLTSGTSRFDWATSESAIRPGAICENFTSFGGVLFGTDRQTRCTEFLRFGASGTCGTVVEPFALWWKFPHPMLHVHYARGCSLAESFYQSVLGPHQLLILGDPLCQPWARIPEVDVEGVKDRQIVRGEIQLNPRATVAGSESIDRFELFVDGNRVQDVPTGWPVVVGYIHDRRWLPRTSCGGCWRINDRNAGAKDHFDPNTQSRPANLGSFAIDTEAHDIPET